MNNTSVPTVPQQPVEEKKKKLSKKAVKRIVVLCVIAVVLLVAILGLRSCMSVMSSMQMPSDTVTLQSGSLVKSVSVTGTIESQQAEKIYAKLNYPVGEIHVEVGDVVQQGDTLCVLDTSELESTLAQRRATASATQATVSQGIASAQRQYSHQQDVVPESYEKQLENAEFNITNEEAKLKSATANMRDLRDQLHDARVAAGYSRQDGASETDIYYNDSELDNLKRAYDAAYDTYEAAKESLELAKKDLQRLKDNRQRDTQYDLETAQDSVANAQNQAMMEDTWLAIEKMEQDLLDATITAPVSGTVTGVYVDKGATANGLMFVIEDTESLQVVTKIKEYDIADIQEGMKVEIRSDSTGSEIFEGKVSRIAPTSLKGATGDTVDSTDAEFETWIEVTTPNSGLRIGANARLTVIVEEKQGVFTVPYEAITYNDAGDEIVYIPVRDEEGNATAQPIVVQTGLENDFSVEITSPDLKEGDEILAEAQAVTPGMPISLLSDFSVVPLQEAGESDAEEAEGEVDGQ